MSTSAELSEEIQWVVVSSARALGEVRPDPVPVQHRAFLLLEGTSTARVRPSIARFWPLFNSATYKIRQSEELKPYLRLVAAPLSPAPSRRS